MKVIAIVIVIFWWIAIWGIFDLFTEHKSKNEKLKIYIVMAISIIIIIACFPHLLDHFC